MLESNFIYVVNDSSSPPEKEILCRFRKDSPDHGHPPDKSKTWSLVLKQAETNSFITLKGVTDFHEKCPYVTSMYLDGHNCRLYDSIRPLEWNDPISTEPYDLLVVGGGAGGIMAAIKAIQQGFRVGLIERSYIGGEHYNTGMISFQALEECAEAAQKIMESKQYGIEISKENCSVNIKKAMEFVRIKRAQITPMFCSVQSLTETYGIDVYLGNAKFLGPQKIVVNDKILDFSKCIIAVGSHLSVPKYEGLANVQYYTIETIYNMNKKPNTMVIFGSGQIACAFAQVFQRLQIEVIIISEETKLLASEVMEDMNKYVDHTLKDLGVKVYTGATIHKIDIKKSDKPSSAQASGQSQTPMPEYVIDADIRGAKSNIVCQAILIATHKTVKYTKANIHSQA